MKTKLPETGYGKCPSECPRFAICLEVAAGLTALEFAYDADLHTSPDADPNQTLGEINDGILLSRAAASTFPAPEPGCPRYAPGR